MVTFLTVIHITCCVFMVLLVLIQSGKGAEISASFGGSSQTVFGASGGANFFTRLTAGIAGVFMVTSVLLTLAANQSKKSVFEGMGNLKPPQATLPAAVPPSNVPSSPPQIPTPRSS